MPCNRCHECRERGEKFCIYCGEYLNYPRSGCERCQECIDEGDAYCRFCGKRLTPYEGEGCEMCQQSKAMGHTYCRYCGRKLRDEENIFLTIGFWVGITVSVLLSFLVLFEYAVAIWGIPQVLPRIGDYGSTLILVIPKIINVVSFNGVPSQIYYILLFIAVSACLALYLYKAYGPAMELGNGNKGPIKDTALFEVSVLFCVLFIWEYVFVLILTFAGVKIDTLPERETWQWMYELLEASVWEEIITRILLIGLPMAIVALAWKREGKGSWKYLFGGFGFSKISLVFILFSAIIFGAGHLNSWGSWKFFTTFAFGLIAGYLFCKYGVYATIIMHFMTDYLSAESWLLGSSGSIMSIMLILMCSLACIPYTYIYLKKCVDGTRNLFKPQNKDLK